MYSRKRKMDSYERSATRPCGLCPLANLVLVWNSYGTVPLRHIGSLMAPAPSGEHTVRRKTTIQDVCIYTDYKADESYTPNRISIRAGSHFNDLVEVEQIELNEPIGWICVPLKDLTSGKPVRAFMIQIAVLSNHQNGRDTHVRRIKIRAPVQTSKLPLFTSIDFNMKSILR